MPSPRRISWLRRSRALPYVLHVDAALAGNSVTLRFVNEGSVGATFHVYDKNHLHRLPRRYAVEAGKSLDDQWMADTDGRFDLLVLGPNGFMRGFTGMAGAALPTLEARYDIKGNALRLALANPGETTASVALGDDLYGVNPPQALALAPKGALKALWPVGRSQGWYDFTVKSGAMTIRLAGRVETGKHGVSDPLMSV